MSVQLNELVEALKGKFALKSHTQNYTTVLMNNDIRSICTLEAEETVVMKGTEVPYTVELMFGDMDMDIGVPIGNVDVDYYLADGTPTGYSEETDSEGYIRNNLTIEEDGSLYCRFEGNSEYPACQSNTLTIKISKFMIKFTGDSFITTSAYTPLFLYTDPLKYRVDDGEWVVYDNGNFNITGLSSGEHTLEFENNETIDSLNDYAFQDVNNITEFEIFITVSSLGMGSFKNTSISDLGFVPQNITELLSECFEDCSNLTSLEGLHTGISSFGESCFKNSGLTSIDLTEFDNINDLYFSCFSNCTNLKTVKLSERINNIYEEVFKECTSLESITFLTEEPPYFENTTFSGVPSTCVMKVPNGCGEDYEQAFTDLGYNFVIQEAN